MAEPESFSRDPLVYECYIIFHCHGKLNLSINEGRSIWCFGPLLASMILYRVHIHPQQTTQYASSSTVHVFSPTSPAPSLMNSIIVPKSRWTITSQSGNESNSIDQRGVIPYPCSIQLENPWFCRTRPYHFLATLPLDCSRLTAVAAAPGAAQGSAPRGRARRGRA